MKDGYEDYSLMTNAKINKKTNALTCKCGSIRTEIFYFAEPQWIEVRCKKCGAVLYYNGA